MISYGLLWIVFIKKNVIKHKARGTKNLKNIIFAYHITSEKDNLLKNRAIFHPIMFLNILFRLFLFLNVLKFLYAILFSLSENNLRKN